MLGIEAKNLTESMRLGRAGEHFAAAHLRGLGWRVVARNWRQGRDEIDLVARDDENLVFVEVKTRRTAATGDGTGRGYFAVNARKRRALLRACRAYMEGMKKAPAHFRFDIIEIKMHKNGLRELQHHRGVSLFPAHFRLKTHA